MRIGIDIDGVCYKWINTALYMMREILPNSPYKNDPAFAGPEVHTSWMHIPDRVEKKHWKWLWDEGVEKGLFRHGDMYPGTVKALNKLSEFGRLVAVTQRPHRAAKDTFDWIGYHGLPFEEIHILQGESKTTTGKYDAFIDDKPDNCRELIKAGTPVVCLPDRPWNQQFGDQYELGVTRTFSWDQFINIVRDYENLSRS